MFDNGTQDSHSGTASSLVLSSDYTMVKFLPQGKTHAEGQRTSRLYQDLQSEPAVCNVRKRDDKRAKEDAHYSEISSQWIKSRMLDWVVSRLYYEQASAVVTQCGKKEKGAIKSNHFQQMLSPTQIGESAGKNYELKQFCNLQGSRWVQMFLSWMLNTCSTRQCGNADRAIIIPSTEVVLSI